VSTGTGPDLRGARLRGPGGDQVESGAAQGARLHAEAMERIRAEQSLQRSQRTAPIGQATPPRLAPPVDSTVVRFIDGLWWPARVLAVVGFEDGDPVVDAICTGPVPHSDLVESRRLRLRVVPDRVAVVQAGSVDVAAAT